MNNSRRQPSYPPIGTENAAFSAVKPSKTHFFEINLKFFAKMFGGMK